MDNSRRRRPKNRNLVLRRHGSASRKPRCTRSTIKFTLETDATQPTLTALLNSFSLVNAPRHCRSRWVCITTQNSVHGVAELSRSNNTTPAQVTEKCCCQWFRQHRGLGLGRARWFGEVSLHSNALDQRDAPTLVYPSVRSTSF